MIKDFGFFSGGFRKEIVVNGSVDFVAEIFEFLLDFGFIFFNVVKIRTFGFFGFFGFIG